MLEKKIKKIELWNECVQVLTAWLPSSKECRPTGVPVRPIDLANEVFDPDGGSDDPGPYSKDMLVYSSMFNKPAWL